MIISLSCQHAHTAVDGDVGRFCGSQRLDSDPSGTKHNKWPPKAKFRCLGPQLLSSAGLGETVSTEVLVPCVVDIDVQPQGTLSADEAETGHASLWAAPGLVTSARPKLPGATWYDPAAASGFRTLDVIDSGRVPGSWIAIPSARLGMTSKFRCLLLPIKQGKNSLQPRTVAGSENYPVLIVSTPAASMTGSNLTT